MNYPRLIDAAHAHIEQKATRPPAKRLLRWALGQILPSRNLLRAMLTLARMATPLAPLLPKFLRAPFDVATALPLPQRPATPLPLHTRGKTRIALHVGCVQDVVAPRVNEAAHRVLTRHGFDVTIVQSCCGSLNHHLGQTKAAHRHAASLVDEIANSERGEPFAAIVTTVSGCGSTIRDYGFHLQGNDAARGIAARTRDIADLLRDVTLQPHDAHIGTRIAYHAACSLTHGMKQAAAAPLVLRKLGFDVVEPRDTNCCGSAGVYNVLEPEIAGQLQQRKATALMAAKPTMIATGNIGCLAQIGAAVRVPVVHTIELIDWATGGPKP